VRRGQAPWRGDRGHLHHRLYDRGWSQRKVVGFYAGTAVLLGLVAVAPPPAGVNAAALKLALLALVGGATLAGLWRLERAEPL
jgi:UDP-GlcNAc:undecaprenyl-phosphate GlcNAc-1-phosphate transferase